MPKTRAPEGNAWRLLMLVGALALPDRAALAQENIERWPTATVEIRSTASHVTRYHVRVADTPARQEQGLMYQHILPTSEGMLFPLPEPQIMRMWMKNTFIALDMLFIEQHGRIACVHERAIPQSEAIITCDKPVVLVLELGGGQAAAQHIHVGDLARVGVDQQ